MNGRARCSVIDIRDIFDVSKGLFIGRTFKLWKLSINRGFNHNGLS